MTIGRAASDILIRIKGDAKDFDAKLKDTNTNLKNFRQNIVSSYGDIATLGGAAAGVFAYMAVDSIKLAAAHEQVERSFNSLAIAQGKNADLYLKSLKRMSHGTVSETEIMKKANQAMLLGLDLDTINTMMESSAVIAQATGQDIGMMFNSMALGTARSSKLLLDNLGIIIDLDKSYTDYAKTNNIINRELTETEKKMAVTNAAMDSAKQKMKDLGGFTDDATSSIQQFNAQMEDLKATVGEVALPSLTAGLTGINDAIFVATEGRQRLKELVDDENRSLKEQELLQKLIKSRTNEQFRAALDAYDIQQLEIINNYTAIDSWDRKLNVIRQVTDELGDQTDEMEKQLSLMDRVREKQRANPNVARKGAGRATMSAATAEALGLSPIRADGTSRIDTRISSRSGL